MAVILTILKWLLRVILVLLAVIVLLLLIILFSGIRYQAEGMKTDKKTCAKGSIKYLFGIVSFRFLYKDGRFRWQAKLFRKVLASSGGKKPRAEQTETVLPPPVTETGNPKKEEAPPENAAVKTAETKKKETHAPEHETEKTEKTQKAPKAPSRLSALKKKEIRFRRKIVRFFRKIKGLLEKKDTLEDLLNDPVIAGAAQKGLNVLKKVLRKIVPRVLEGEVVFGLSDPSTTGKILAFLAAVSPGLPGEVSVTPDFENRIFEGRGHCSGCVRLKTFAGAAISLLLNKNIRQSVKIIKNIKNTGGMSNGR